MPPEPTSRDGQEIQRLSDLSPQQWKSGIAAWLGWLFDGLDMQLYTLVATPFVAQLLVIDNQRDPSVGYYGSVIQAAGDAWLSAKYRLAINTVAAQRTQPLYSLLNG